MTLDVGHAKLSGVEPAAFRDGLGVEVVVRHLQDNDGTDDDHDPLPEFRGVAADVGAEYNVLEMKSLGDVGYCVGATAG